LSKNPEKVLNSALSTLKGETRQKAEKQVEKVKDVFNTDNLIAGIELLKSVSKEFTFKDKRLLFPRYGNWLIGYVTLNGYWVEKEKDK
jgi:hypothetical protein